MDLVYTAPIDGFHLAARGVPLLLLFVLSGFATLLALTRLHKEKSDFPLLFAIAMTVGPLLAALALTAALWLAPGRAPAFYLGLIAVVAGVPGVYGASKHAKDCWEGALAYGRALLARPLIGLAAVALLLAIALLLGQQVLVAFFQPPYSNDSLEYLAAGRFLAQSADIRDYPFLDRETTGGFVSVWTHPPAYVVLAALSYWLQGSAEFSGIAKFLSPYFVAAQALLLLTFVDPGRRLAGPLAALLCIGTPVYFLLSSQYHIDSLRIAAFTAAAASAWLAARRPSLGAGALAGIAVGASAFTHSMGFLTLGFVLPLFCLIARGPVRKAAASAALMTGVGAAMAAPFAARNLEVFGSILQDSGPIWRIKELAVAEMLAIERGIYTLADKAAFGVLKGFSQPEFFGSLWWALLAAIIIAAFSQGPLNAARAAIGGEFRRSAIGAALILVGGFLAFFAATVAAGTDLAIKNFRYVLTAQPFAAAALGGLLAMAIEGEERGRR